MPLCANFSKLGYFPGYWETNIAWGSFGNGHISINSFFSETSRDEEIVKIVEATLVINSIGVFYRRNGLPCVISFRPFWGFPRKKYKQMQKFITLPGLFSGLQSSFKSLRVLASKDYFEKLVKNYFQIKAEEKKGGLVFSCECGLQTLDIRYLESGELDAISGRYKSSDELPEEVFFKAPFSIWGTIPFGKLELYENGINIKFSGRQSFFIKKDKVKSIESISTALFSHDLRINHSSTKAPERIDLPVWQSHAKEIVGKLEEQGYQIISK